MAGCRAHVVKTMSKAGYQHCSMIDCDVLVDGTGGVGMPGVRLEGRAVCDKASAEGRPRSCLGPRLTQLSPFTVLTGPRAAVLLAAASVAATIDTACSDTDGAMCCSL
jgi:hypothetical protein